MTVSLRIAIDAMGGDLGPQAAIPAVLAAAPHSPQSVFHLYGEANACSSLLFHAPNNVVFHPTTNSVHMDDAPAQALRHKRDSSMAMAIQAAANGDADAVISAGNTGALMAMSAHFIHLLDGVDRPALCQAMPTAKAHSYILDLGANVDCSAQQLLQFARLGSALSCLLDNKQNPQVRLLNIGSEANKGSTEVKQAATLLGQQRNINYQGFVEGNQICAGVADVIVCDGFAGNIALKASEGVARYITQELKSAYRQTWFSRLLGVLSKPVLQQWFQEMNPDRYNGAYLLGLDAIVIKSHGGVNQQQFGYALEMLLAQLQRQSSHSVASMLQRFTG